MMYSSPSQGITSFSFFAPEKSNVLGHPLEKNESTMAGTYNFDSNAENGLG
ncbi:MAG: hypothetical protein IPO07_12160 [Haliscomenobacter sp.]|nr:hypothetical protein [Haliscomenobacter sp.]MBK9489450.1 hypothetical protein [Haliscomenobacter sp.]